MKKINFLIVFLFISIVDCHISIVKNLIKDEKYKLKGTFTINCAEKQIRYLSIDSGKTIVFISLFALSFIESINLIYLLLPVWVWLFPFPLPYTLGIIISHFAYLHNKKDVNNSLITYCLR